MGTSITEYNRLYFQLAAKGLIGKVLDEVKKMRPDVSRNTLRLAYMHGPTTPARKLILGISQEVLDASVPAAANESSLPNS